MRLCLTLLFSLLALPVFSQSNAEINKPFAVHFGFERYSGYTVYQIEYNNRPLSELKFPITILMLSADFRYQMTPKLNFNFNIKANPSKKAYGFDEMEDSDWGIYYETSGHNPAYSPSSLDIFSRSRTELQAFFLDLNFEVRLSLPGEQFALHLGGGFIYQSFAYDAYDLSQWSPSVLQYSSVPGFSTLNPGQYYVDVPGKVLTYSVKYYIPYLLIEPRYIFTASWSLLAHFRLAPIALASDKDNHILRNKISKGDSIGFAGLASLEIIYRPYEIFSFSAFASYFLIRTYGTQTQTENGVYTATINNTIKSDQICLALKTGFYF